MILLGLIVANAPVVVASVGLLGWLMHDANSCSREFMERVLTIAMEAENHENQTDDLCNDECLASVNF